MSRHSWKTSVAAKQMPVFSLYQVMDEDANVTIWLKGAVQMSGGGSLAARCPSCCTPPLPGRGYPGQFVLELPRGACQDQAVVPYVWGIPFSSFFTGLMLAPPDVVLALLTKHA